MTFKPVDYIRGSFMHYILFIIGLITVICAIFILYRKAEEEKRIYVEILKMYEEIKDYMKITEDIIEDLEVLIGNSINIINEIDEKNKSILEEAEFNKDIFSYKEKNKSDLLNEEVINLVNHGYSKKEIARKLNRGIREVDIILRMHNKNK